MPVERITLGDLRFDVAVDGAAQTEPVLMLHGFPQDHTCWDALSGSLLDAGFRTVRPDQRGFSPGARPQGRSAYRLSETAGDALGLLDALGIDRAHVVGHDWGGAVAWSLGARHPDRVRTLTVLSTPHPAALGRAMVRTTQGMRSWYMAMFQIPGLPERLLRPGTRFWRAFMRGLPSAARQHYERRIMQPGAATAMLNWYRAAGADLLASGSRRSWPPVAVPTLLIRGADDPALGPQAAAMSADWCSGPYQLVELPGQGHWLPERAADQIAPLLLGHLRGEEGPVQPPIR